VTVPATEDRLGAALRRLVDALCVTELPDAEADEVAAAVERLADRVETRPPLTDPALRYFQSSPLVGFRNPVAPPIERYRDGAERALCDVTLGPRYEGNVGWVHGAWVAAVWDEVLAVAKDPVETPSVTGTLTIRYRQPTPVGTPLHFVAEVDRTERRKTFVTGRCVTPDGTLTSEAEAIFISVDPRMVPAFNEGRTQAD
jgi:acyl-coenzyme A thioesterase PaaI-like protein